MSAPVSNKAQKVISSGGSSLSDFLNTVNAIKGTDATQSLPAGLFVVESSAVFKEQSGIAFFVSFPRSPSLGSFEVKALEIFRLPRCKSSVCLPLHFTMATFWDNTSQGGVLDNKNITPFFGRTLFVVPRSFLEIVYTRLWHDFASSG